MLVSEKKTSKEDVSYQLLRVRLREPQEEFLQAIAGFNWEQLMRGMEKLLQAEWDLKSGNLDPEVGLSLLVSGLMKNN